MNRKQEVAAWIFGLIIAIGLVLTGYGIWALLVLAALTILSLRDRQKKRKEQIAIAALQHKEASKPTPELTLKNVTPHLLAVGVLQIVHEGGDMWRTPDVEIPERADSAFAIACESYEIRIFLDLLEQRFGSGISKLVEASVASVMGDLDRASVFQRFNAAITRARRLGPTEQGPEDPNLRLDLQVADQILSFIGESEDERQGVRFALAQSLSRARISAQHFFPAVVAKTDFDPVSVAMVERETEYKGTSSRWIEMPGCFERHLQRKEDNFLFSAGKRQPTQDEIDKARAKDKADVEELRKNIAVFFRDKAGPFRDQATIAGDDLVDFLQNDLVPLMKRAAEIGKPAMREFETLEKLRDSLFKVLDDARPSGKAETRALKESLQRALNLFLAQIWRSDTPIRAEEIAPALLCESTDTMTVAVEVLQHSAPETMRMLYETSVSLLNSAMEEGFDLPGANEKLVLLRNYCEGAKSTATV